MTFLNSSLKTPTGRPLWLFLLDNFLAPSRRQTHFRVSDGDQVKRVTEERPTCTSHRDMHVMFTYVSPLMQSCRTSYVPTCARLPMCLGFGVDEQRCL